MRTFSKTYGYLQAGLSGPGALIASETLPDGEVQSYAYDAGEEKVAIRSQPASAKFAEDVVRDLRRNARGELTSVTFGNLWVDRLSSVPSGPRETDAGSFFPNGRTVRRVLACVRRVFE